MAVNNSLVKTEDKPKTFSAYITGDAIKNKINQMVGGNDGQTFITAILSAVSTNPALSECDHSSIVSAALLGQSLKLSPSPQLGQYYLVPFNDNKRGCKVAQFQLGYKGYVQLAERSGYYKKINVLAIKEGELIKFDPLNEEIEVNLIEDEEARENTPTVGYYAMFEYHNGFRKAIYWSKKKMLIHADKYSQAFTINATNGKYSKVSYADYEAGKVKNSDLWQYSSFWYKDFDGMAYKTMLRQLISKWGIMSVELQNAFEKDMGAIKEDGTVEYIDNQKNDDNEVSIITEDVVVEAKSNTDTNKVSMESKETYEEIYEDPFK